MTHSALHEPAAEPINEPEMLRLYLSARDVECPGCGYNLRGLGGDACPECNEALAMRVTLAEPQARAFIAGLVGLACGAGGFGLMLAWVLIMTLIHGPAPSKLIYVIPAIGVAVETPVLLFWIGARSRRWLRSLPPQRRAGAAAACWGLTLVLFAICIIGFMDL